MMNLRWQHMRGRRRKVLIEYFLRVLPQSFYNHNIAFCKLYENYVIYIIKLKVVKLVTAMKITAMLLMLRFAHKIGKTKYTP